MSAGLATELVSFMGFPFADASYMGIMDAVTFIFVFPFLVPKLSHIVYRQSLQTSYFHAASFCDRAFLFASLSYVIRRTQARKATPSA